MQPLLAWKLQHTWSDFDTGAAYTLYGSLHEKALPAQNDSLLKFQGSLQK